MPHPRDLTLALPALTVAQINALFEFFTRLQDQLWIVFEKDLVDLARAQSKVVLARAAARGPSPPLSGEDAYQLVQLLERADRAVWTIHGDAIADYLACVDPEAMADFDGPDAPSASPPGSDSDDEPNPDF